MQRFVRRLDLSEARGHFRTAWLIGALTSVPVAALVAAIVAYLTRNPLPAIIVFLAPWRCPERSWDDIPRKRQDRDRPLPPLWDIASAGVLALVFGIALFLLVSATGDGRCGNSLHSHMADML